MTMNDAPRPSSNGMGILAKCPTCGQRVAVQHSSGEAQDRTHFLSRHDAGNRSCPGEMKYYPEHQLDLYALVRINPKDIEYS